MVRISHKMGDRKDYFSTLDDVWEMFRVIAAKRKEREIDPTADVLRECIEESAKRKSEAHSNRRMREVLELIDVMSTWYEQMDRLPPAAITKGARLGAKLGKLLGGK